MFRAGAGTGERSTAWCRWRQTRALGGRHQAAATSVVEWRIRPSREENERDDYGRDKGDVAMGDTHVQRGQCFLSPGNPRVTHGTMRRERPEHLGKHNIRQNSPQKLEEEHGQF